MFPALIKPVYFPSTYPLGDPVPLNSLVMLGSEPGSKRAASVLLFPHFLLCLLSSAALYSQRNSALKTSGHRAIFSLAPHKNTWGRGRTTQWQRWELAPTTHPLFWICWCPESHFESHRRQKSSDGRGVGVQTAVVFHLALWLIGGNRVAILVKCIWWMLTRQGRCSGFISLKRNVGKVWQK